MEKDHSAIAKPRKYFRLCQRGKFPDYTRYSGGVYSRRMVLGKNTSCIRTDTAVRKAAVNWIELSDWIPAILSGTQAPHKIKRGRCAAGHKCLWHQEWQGLPSAEFLAALDPALTENLRAILFTETWTADVPVGKITAEWAERLGLQKKS